MNLKLEALFQRQVYIQIVPLFNSNNYLRNITSTVELIFSKYRRMGQLSTPELSATLISNLEQGILEREGKDGNLFVKRSLPKLLHLVCWKEFCCRFITDIA